MRFHVSASTLDFIENSGGREGNEIFVGLKMCFRFLRTRIRFKADEIKVLSSLSQFRRLWKIKLKDRKKNGYETDNVKLSTINLFAFSSNEKGTKA